MFDYYSWLDALWLPVLFFLLHEKQKLWGVGLAVTNMIMMRMLIELMGWIGYPDGFFGLLDYSLLTRGLALYSLVYLVYLTIALYSPKSEGPLFLGMSIGVFFTASVLFSIIMVL